MEKLTRAIYENLGRIAPRGSAFGAQNLPSGGRLVGGTLETRCLLATFPRQAGDQTRDLSYRQAPADCVAVAAGRLFPLVSSHVRLPDQPRLAGLQDRFPRRGSHRPLESYPSDSQFP